MSLIINALTTGAGIVTPLTGQSQLEGNLIIGDVDTAQPCQGVKIIVDGRTTIDVQGSQPLVSVLSKFKQNVVGAVVGLVLKIATGRIYKSCSYFFTNNGVTTPSVFAFSDAQQEDDGSPCNPIEAVTLGINALSNQTFKDFSGIFITPAANLGSFDVVFSDGTTQSMTAIEADALFSLTNDTESNGRLDAVVTGFDNTGRNISEVKVNATTALTVMVVKLPQTYFDRTFK